MKKYLTSAPGAYLVIVVLVLLAYGLVIENGYVWDDRYFLVDYTWIDTIPDAIKASLQPLFGQRAYVRPLALFTLYLEAIASGRNPAVSHAVNLLLHLLSSLLVYVIARRAWADSMQGRGGWVSLLAGALFAVHPALTENVAWISSRFDLLATLFALAAIWLAGSRVADWPRAFGVAGLFFLAALCKESVAVLPAVLGGLAMFQAASLAGRPRLHLADAFTARQLKLYLLLFAAGVAYLLVRHQVLSGAQLLQYAPASLEQHLVWMGVSLYEYAKLTLIPFVGNSPHHSFLWHEGMGFGDYWQKASLGFALLVLALGLAAGRRRAGWWLLLWLTCFLPVLHLIQLTIGGNIVHQRFMYLPTAVLIGFSPYALVSLRLSEVGARAAVAISWLLVALSVLVCNTIVPAWKNDMTLWKWTVAMDPGSVEARENLIWSYLEAGMFDEANEQMTFIREHGMRTTATVAVNMGVAHYRRGEFEQADFYYEIARDASDTMPKDQQARLLSNMSINYAVQGKAGLAGKTIIDSLVLDPRNTMALSHLIGYCPGVELRLDEYKPEEVARAREGSNVTRQVVSERQPGLLKSLSLCPPAGGSNRWR
ncbi:hypothetical protein CSC62_08105 [Pseudoxanthomonas jiangsuensis]|uniref:hypothetical protein n=1 Tax=Pseudoxanthomonas jiangsuensis TaxID=619688 RepID=UPI001391FCDA|nr:hypothetical protein [Pseudoxanthomonas jiangsuensis]KAF1697886.1 hypothetical protein CSC62_08105 [Pseudoxanthomonas jiangsuensis]